jgi:hypothetical protein
MVKFLFVALLFVLLACLVEVDAVGRQQAAAARGILRCKGRPASGLNVKMYGEF